jgi:hypothetical protein
MEWPWRPGRIGPQLEAARTNQSRILYPCHPERSGVSEARPAQSKDPCTAFPSIQRVREFSRCRPGGPAFRLAFLSRSQTVGDWACASECVLDRDFVSGSGGIKPLLRASVVPALRTEREGRGTPFIASASEFKNLGHPPKHDGRPRVSFYTICGMGIEDRKSKSPPCRKRRDKDGAAAPSKRSGKDGPAPTFRSPLLDAGRVPQWLSLSLAVARPDCV